jgi:hypothetical protein
MTGTTKGSILSRRYTTEKNTSQSLTCQRAERGASKMFQEKVVVQDRLADTFAVPLTHLHYEVVNLEEILRVLDRAASDDRFIAQLTCQGSRALQGYNLTAEEKAALLSGDISWIEAHVGKLDRRMRTWLECRLQQEIW